MPALPSPLFTDSLPCVYLNQVLQLWSLPLSVCLTRSMRLVLRWRTSPRSMETSRWSGLCMWSSSSRIVIWLSLGPSRGQSAPYLLVYIFHLVSHVPQCICSEGLPSRSWRPSSRALVLSSNCRSSDMHMVGRQAAARATLLAANQQQLPRASVHCF